MIMGVAAAKAFRRRQGRGALGGRYCHCLRFGFVEMLEQGEKAKPFYNVYSE